MKGPYITLLTLGILGLTACSAPVRCARPDPYPPARNVSWIPPCPDRFKKFSDLIAPIDYDKETSLCELLDLSLSSNPNTYLSWSTAKSAYMSVGIAEAALYPTLEFQGQLFRSLRSGNIFSLNQGQSSVVTTSPNENAVTGALALSWLLLDFGGRSNTILAAKKALIAANWTHNRTIQTVIQEVISAYYMAVEYQALVISNQENVNDNEMIVKATKAQLGAGLTTSVAYYQAESNLMQAILNLETAKGNVQIALAQLAQAVGIEACPQIKTIPLPDELPVEDVQKDVCKLIELAKAYRPDLSSAMATYEQMEAEILVAKAPLYPSFTGLVDLTRTRVISTPQQSAINRFYALSMNWNLFNGFQDRYNYLKAKEQRDIAYAQWKIIEEQVEVDVVTAVTNWIVAQQNIKTSTSYLEYAKKAFQGAFEGYKAGVNTILDLLTAENTLAAARAALIQAKTNWIVGLANIAYATGTLNEMNDGCPNEDCGSDDGVIGEDDSCDKENNE